jgi:hypothetical protein
MAEADEACRLAGGRLPTVTEFRQLSAYLGYGTKRGYSPYVDDGKTEILKGISDHIFWSSSKDKFFPGFTYSFFGKIGQPDFASPNFVLASALCVSGSTGH